MTSAIFDFPAIGHALKRMRGQVYSGTYWGRDYDGTLAIIDSHDWDWENFNGYRCVRCGATREQIADRIAPGKCAGRPPARGGAVAKSRFFSLVATGDGYECYRVDVYPKPPFPGERI